jgi:hypothetical protein
MFWRRSKPVKPQGSLITFLDERNAPQPDSEMLLSEALRQHETEFYKKISSALDQDAERAKKVGQQARTFIQDSRLAHALCRPLLEKGGVCWSTTLDRGLAPRRSPTRRSSRRVVRAPLHRHPRTQPATT